MGEDAGKDSCMSKELVKQDDEVLEVKQVLWRALDALEALADETGYNRDTEHMDPRLRAIFDDVSDVWLGWWNVRT